MSVIASLVFGLAVLSTASPLPPSNTSGNSQIYPYKHVAAFSVDGLHSSDIDKYLTIRPKSTIAALLATGLRYTNANTTAPSDSFPGSVAQYTGASPRVAGVWYDVIYDRSVFAPGDSKCAGMQGHEIADDETLDYDPTQLFSGGINPANLNYYLDKTGKCSLMYPHDRVRVNTAFEVVKGKGLQTAYTDKHPAYEIMNGPSGTGLSTGYFPEIAAIGPTYQDTIAYDQLHVNAFLKWLSGQVPANSTGTLNAIPTLFGGNFQAVSVAQKTVGYLNATGNPLSPAIIAALDFVDQSLGQVVAKMKAVGIFDSTLIIVASKHGQSPINPQLLDKIDPATVAAAAGVPVLYEVADDVSMLFLNNTYDTYQAVENLKTKMGAEKFFKIWAATNNALSITKAGFGSPLRDPAVPDILITPDHGVIYTTSTTKLAEHGGFSNDDRNVACFLSSPRISPAVITEHVKTQQIGPTILKALGIDPSELQGAVLEKTAALPGPPFGW